MKKTPNFEANVLWVVILVCLGVSLPVQAWQSPAAATGEQKSLLREPSRQKSATLQDSTSGEEIRTLRVLSYNIHHGEGIDRQLDLNRIAKVILSVHPDLVALQEVDQKTTRTDQVDQLAELKKLTKMPYAAFGANLDFQGGKYGNAILSKHPFTRQQNTPLPNLTDGEPRGILSVQISSQAIGTQSPLLFMATHFDHRRIDTDRIRSAKVIPKIIAQNEAKLAIIAGDFNDVDNSPTLKAIEAHLQRSNSTILPTVPVKSPTRQIDFVFSWPKTRFHCLKTTVLKEAVASDHRAVLAVFKLN